MTVGELAARVWLDSPQKVHYGPNDAVKGKVVLQYNAPTTKGLKKAEHPPLFGPLQVNAVIRGYLKIKVNERGDASFNQKDETVLCTVTRRIHDGPFRANPDESIELPFSMKFPEHIDSQGRLKTHIVFESDGTRRYVSEPISSQNEDLPPSFRTVFVSPSGTNRGLVSAEYYMDTEVEMPGIPAKIEVHDYKPRIRYEQPQLLRPPEANDMFMGTHIQITSDKLNPDPDGRRSSISHRAKSIFRSSDAQSLLFELFCTGIPDEIYQGQTISCKVGVRINQEESTVACTPDITLKYFNARIVAHTRVEVPGNGIDRPNDISIVKSLTTDIYPPGPFTKETDYMKTVSTNEPLQGVPCSFSLAALTRSYKIRLEMQVCVAGQFRQIRRDFPVLIHPPVWDGAGRGESSVVAGPSRRAAAGVDDEQLPAYVESESAPPVWAEHDDLGSMVRSAFASASG